MFLMPGLVDFHVHPGGVDELPSYLLYGQTTVITMGGEGLQLRKQLHTDIAPHLITSGHTLDNNPPTNRRFHGVKAPSDAPATMDLQLAQKADFVKIYGRMKLPEFQAIIEEAHKRNLSVAGHIPQTLTAEQALSGLDMVAHGEEYFRFLGKPPSDSAIADVVALTAKYKTAVTPNLVGYVAMPTHAANLPSLLKDKEVRFLPASIYQEWLPQNNRYATRPNIPEFVGKLSSWTGCIETPYRPIARSRSSSCWQERMPLSSAFQGDAFSMSWTS